MFLGMIFFLILVLIAWFSNRKITENAKGRTFFSAEEIPYNKVGVLLGTAKYLKSGAINPYFAYRVEAAVTLFKAGKIDFILVSGDNSQKDTDEPTDFKNELVAKGVPAERIFLDYAGFRTLDSVVRVKAIFGQTSVTFISQKFHNERAIYLADNKGISAVGYNATDLPRILGLKVQIREYLARVKVFWDLFLGVEPKFYGEKIDIVFN